MELDDLAGRVPLAAAPTVWHEHLSVPYGREAAGVLAEGTVWPDLVAAGSEAPRCVPVMGKVSVKAVPPWDSTVRVPPSCSVSMHTSCSPSESPWRMLNPSGIPTPLSDTRMVTCLSGS